MPKSCSTCRYLSVSTTQSRCRYLDWPVYPHTLPCGAYVVIPKNRSK